MTIREIFHSIKEMFNAFLDADLIEILILIGGLWLILMWTAFIFFIFQELLQRVESWWEKKNPFAVDEPSEGEEGNFLIALLLFFPSLLFSMIPAAIIFFLGMMTWFIPVFLIVFP
tara:strand:+ start:218 stop:565 length:348 start_codon:yes stop_codon:yes gene_type:complete